MIINKNTCFKSHFGLIKTQSIYAKSSSPASDAASSSRLSFICKLSVGEIRIGSSALPFFTIIRPSLVQKLSIVLAFFGGLHLKSWTLLNIDDFYLAFNFTICTVCFQKMRGGR